MKSTLYRAVINDKDTFKETFRDFEVYLDDGEKDPTNFDGICPIWEGEELLRVYKIGISIYQAKDKE